MSRRLQNIHRAIQQARDSTSPRLRETASLRTAIEKRWVQFNSLWRRSSDCSDGTNSSSGSSCGSHSSSNSVSLPVALGVIIPIAIAVVLFVYLHRRHVKRLRNEDINDPHKSLDFGWDPTNQGKMDGRSKSRRNKKQPEMKVVDLGTEKKHHDRGLSMDMDLGSPYVLPPGLHGSHESLHSMSRNMHTQDDRYRPATTYVPSDSGSIRSGSNRRGRMDDSSSIAASSVRRGRGDDMKQDLLANAQRMSRSVPPVNRIPDVPEIRMPEAVKEVSRKALPSSANAVPSSAALSPGAAVGDGRDSYVTGDEGGLRRSNTYLGKFIHSGNSSSDLLNESKQGAINEPTKQNTAHKKELSVNKELPSVPAPDLQVGKRKPPPPAISTETAPEVTRPPRTHSLHASQHPSIEHSFYEDNNDFGDGFHVQPPSPGESQHALPNADHDHSQDFMPPINEDGLAIDEAGGLGFDVRRLSVGIRPLPPDDPSDNAEQRANRIRSFYKEYFDDSKPGPAHGGYYEDYDENYLGGEGATYFDPVSGQFITSGIQQPFAEPYGRRAMTPPPRANGGGRRHAATLSGTSDPRQAGPRAFSSASGRFGPSGRGIPPKRKLPPPGPLRQIPTPHLLKEDAFALPIDFAPPLSARDRQAGRPASPRGGLRPYSPSVPVHSPLASSYDDLAVMPSPHLLRKSGVFTALDFAPPPRIKSSDDGRSDDGRSIRSNRSAMSARQQHALRAGAYRVSRIPKEVVGTKGDLMTALKPQWNMHNNDSRVGMDPQLGGGMVL